VGDINRERDRTRRTKTRKANVMRTETLRPSATCVDVTEGSDSGRPLSGADLYTDAGFASVVSCSSVVALCAYKLTAKRWN
jgi:hypothetical protein